MYIAKIEFANKITKIMCVDKRSCRAYNHVDLGITESNHFS